MYILSIYTEDERRQTVFLCILLALLFGGIIRSNSASLLVNKYSSTQHCAIVVAEPFEPLKAVSSSFWLADVSLHFEIISTSWFDKLLMWPGCLHMQLDVEAYFRIPSEGTFYKLTVKNKYTSKINVWKYPCMFEQGLNPNKFNLLEICCQYGVKKHLSMQK